VSDSTPPDFGSRFIVASVDNRVLQLRIDRAERRNAFTQDMYRAVKRAAIWANDEPELDAVCITGTDQWFGAGGDMAGGGEDPQGLAAEWDSTDHFPFRHIERCKKLWVAKVNGVCHAGSLDLVLYADVAIASDRARFRVPELLRGIPDPLMSARLADAVGLARARYLFFTAAEIDAPTALAMGLVGEVVAHDQLDDRVEWVLEQIRLTGPAARAMVKRDLNSRLPAADMGMFHDAIRSAEMREGMAAFINKRPPDWPR
jgi:enoyl-CoA hydratase/carnithine racemase